MLAAMPIARRLALVLGLLGFAPSTPAQPGLPLDWERGVMATVRRPPEVADWIVEHVGAAAIPRLRGVLRDWRWNYAAAIALVRLDLGRLAPELQSPYGAVRDSVTAAVLSIGDRTRYFHTRPQELLPGVLERAKFEAEPDAETLIAGLSSDDAERRVICEAILRAYRRPTGNDPWPGADYALDRLERGNAIERRGALLALTYRRLTEEQRQRVLAGRARALDDDDTAVRRTAYEVSCDRNDWCRPVEIAPLLERALAESDAIAITCLGALGMHQSNASLAPIAFTDFEARSPEVRAALLRFARGLVHRGAWRNTPEIGAHVRRSLDDRSAEVRAAALAALLMTFREDGAGVTVARLVGDECEAVREMATTVASRAPDLPMLRRAGVLEAALRDPYAGVRRAAVNGLLYRPRAWGARDESLMLRALEDPSAVVRVAAVSNLRRAPLSESISSAWVDRLADPDRRVVHAARAGLLRRPSVARAACIAAAFRSDSPAPIGELANVLAAQLVSSPHDIARTIGSLIDSDRARTRAIGLLAATRLGSHAWPVARSITSRLASPIDDDEARRAARALVSVGPRDEDPTGDGWAAWVRDKWAHERSIAGASARDSLRHARERFGVTIEFPDRGVDGLRTTAIAPTHRARAAAAVVAALERYPRAALAGRLARVCVVGTLKLWGRDVGGTYRGDAIYIATSGLSRPRYVSAIFHHELSSLFAKADGFPWATWRAANAPSEAYLGSPFSAIRIGLVGVGDEDDFARGFFAPYAAATAEEDFNVFAETVMTDPVWARTCIERHPALRRKWDAWCACMRAVAPAFSPPFVLRPPGGGR